MSAVVELLQDLIRIPSVNPQGDTGTTSTGEEEIARFTGNYLAGVGMEVEMQYVEKGRPNVIGRFKSQTSRHHILLGPHIDTVGVIGMTIDPFGGILKDGRIWGRGACDTKGPMAAMLVAISLLSQEKRRPRNTDIWFAGLMGEESGNNGIAFLMESDFLPKKGARLDFGIAGEPTDLKIVYRHKGALWFRIRTKGRSCHASRAELGENAILKMRKAIDYISNELPKGYRKEDALLGKGSFNLTVIRGGCKVNVIPESCEIEVDHRSLPQESHAKVIKSVREALPECEVEIISDRPGLDTSPENPYIHKLADVLGRQMCNGKKAPHAMLPEQRQSFLTGAPWTADSLVMAKCGVPSIAFGPGSVAPAHTKDEFIEVAELEKGVEVFREFLESLD